MPPGKNKGFVTRAYDEEWWVAYALQVSEDSEQVCVSFLHSRGPLQSLKYPARPDILTIPVEDALISTIVLIQGLPGDIDTHLQKGECNLQQRN